MANFRTHVSSSIVLGAAYGAAGHLLYDMPLPSSALAAGLCALGGLLPDMDSDNAVILRESVGLVAAVTPLLALDQLSNLQLPRETIVLICVGLYLAIRFLLGGILRHWTVHRGMWHSIPAAAIAGMVVYYLSTGPDDSVRIFKTAAIVLGFLWHLLLDEIYAVEIGRVRVKRSFGTALKFWGEKPLATVVAYLLLMAVTFGIAHARSVENWVRPLPGTSAPYHARRSPADTPPFGHDTQPPRY